MAQDAKKHLWGYLISNSWHSQGGRELESSEEAFCNLFRAQHFGAKATLVFTSATLSASPFFAPVLPFRRPGGVPGVLCQNIEPGGGPEYRVEGTVAQEINQQIFLQL